METLKEKIKTIEEEIRETPYHKGTQYHIGRLRARIARLKEEITQKETKIRRGGGRGFALKKFGDATVVLVGPPSVGKSTLLNRLTNAQAKVAAYDFTTLEVIPGMMDYLGAKIQIFDIPGIIRGATKGLGRGKAVLSIVRVADLLLLMVDITTVNLPKNLQKELYEVGLRLNQKPPPIRIIKKSKGGLKIIAPSASLTAETIRAIAEEFRLTNGEIIIKGNPAPEDLVDAFCANRIYLPFILVLNKIDLLPGRESLATILKRMEDEEVISISAEKNQGLGDLKKAIWEKLDLIKVYLKPQGQDPDFTKPLILKRGATVFKAAQKIHGELADAILGAQVWGRLAKFPGQKVALNHLLFDGDVLTLLPK